MNLTESDDLYFAFYYITNPSSRVGSTLNYDGYNLFFDYLDQLQSNDIISYCVGETYM